MGTVPSPEVIRGLGLPIAREEREEQREGGMESAAPNNLAAIIPLLNSVPAETREKGELKPSRYLVAKGLPTLPVKLVEKAWNKEYVDMEEFLPTPRSICLADQARTSSSLQESLVGALSQFQALQHHQKSHRPGMDVLTWTKCFSLYIAVMSRKHPDMIPSMVAHMHTVMKLNQKVPKSMSWYEYDIGSGWRWQHQKTALGPAETRGSILRAFRV